MATRSTDILEGSRLPEYFRDELKKAFSTQSLQVAETTEFYLVSLLTNFERAECLYVLSDDRYIEEPLAILLARAISGDKASQIKGLKRLGDVSLYLTGFFEDHISRGPVGINYYVDMGSFAYSSLASQFSPEDVFANLYAELSGEFKGLASALASLGIQANASTNSDLLNLYERWLKSGDENIRRKLMEEGIIPTKETFNC